VPRILLIGAIVVSVLNSLAFITALAMAYRVQDAASISLLIGAVVANASTVVSFWLGSSSGSMQKTALLAQAPAVVTPPPVVQRETGAP